MSINILYFIYFSHYYQLILLFCSLTFSRMTSENRAYLQDVFCGDGGYVRGSAPGNRETKKFRARTKNRDRRWATHIRSDNLTVCPNVRTRNFKFHYFPFEVTPPISSLPAEKFLKQGLFSILSKWEVSNNIAVEIKVRPEGFTKGNTFKPRRFTVFPPVLLHWASDGKCEGSEADVLMNLSGWGDVCGMWLWRNLLELLRDGKMLLNGARGLSERTRVAPSAVLHLDIFSAL